MDRPLLNKEISSFVHMIYLQTLGIWLWKVYILSLCTFFKILLVHSVLLIFSVFLSIFSHITALLQ